MADPKTSTDFYIRLNEGSESAAEELDRRYRRQLCALVERELGKRFAAREDPEDAVQSALRSFYRGIDAGRFRIENSAKLWRLLEDITRKKVLKHVEHHDAQKRKPAAEVRGEGDWFSGREPQPEEVIHVADLIEQVLEGLEPPDPEVFRLRLQGCTRAEIAEQVNCSDGVVKAKLDRIRDRLRRLLKDGSDR